MCKCPRVYLHKPRCIALMQSSCKHEIYDAGAGQLPCHAPHFHPFSAQSTAMQKINLAVKPMNLINSLCPLLYTALFQYLPPESREFEDIMKILSTSYLQSSSAGAFVYTKAQLVQNELLEKDFAEKRREMKQNGRTDSELLESYGFLLLESYKVGLLEFKVASVYLAGVYLSRYSDLLQINPFNVDAAGDIIIFKVLKGKVKTISMSRNILDPTPNFDCHVSTNAHKVTSCLSYRAFELTQQYFYEYKFDEIKERPRHVRPHAVVSFIYKGNAALSTHKPMPPLRSNSRNSECRLTRKSIYTVWTGQLLNQGKVLCHVAIRSFTQLFLPFKLPEQLEMEKAMKLAEVKWRIPIALLSWDTYVDTGKGENGLHGSLFEVVDVSKHNSISSLLLMLEKEKMVLVKPLDDQGFLFLLSSKQLTNSNGIERGWTQSLLALFLSQESRGEVKPLEDLRPDARNPIIPHLKTFLPALHYALCTLRASHPADPGAEVEREARAYMIGCSNKTHQSFHLAEYKENCKVQKKVYSYSRMNHDVEGSLHSYFYNPKFYQLAVAVAKEIVDVVPPPVCDTSMLDVRASEIRLFSRDGARTRQPQPMNDPGKMKELLKLIHLRKRNVAEEEGERNLVGDCGDRKRKAEDEAVGLVKKYLRTEDNRRESGGGAYIFERRIATREQLLERWSVGKHVFDEYDIAFEEAKDIESIGKNHLKKAETVPSNNTTNTDELVSQGPSIVDTILNEEFSNFSTEIQKLLKGEQVEYHSEMSMTFPQDLQWQDEVVFSEYVSHYTHPVPVHSYISTLRDHMNQLINCPSDHWEKATVCIPPPSSVCDHASLSAHSPARSVSFPCTSLNCTADTTLPTSEPVHSPPQHAVTTDFYQPLLNCSPDLQSPVVDSSGHTPLNTNVPVPEPMSKSINSVISQIRPDMFNTLLEIMKDVQKNTVKFYVHSMEENSVCSEIKDYLIQLGNAECKPHVFLESKNSLDKLLIIIQNKDIAAHIHTIPLLLYLKKLSSVSFAGVDSLEDVKNHTYNELFVSGGFIVSDEFVLNPDFITQSELQLLLTFLEEKNCANTHWCWKVHCKTHKKLKELARVNNEALGLLNLLSTYQRRHVVEFLPYHECDCGTRQAPDLECLIKLQAQNVHYRHIIFLTERHFEMFPHHSKNGIMIASISNIMDSLPGCTSSTASCLETLEPNPSCPLVMFTGL
uniref:Transcription activation suppressor b n=1 Tax=Scleropages formosus TaxID=113540 RepID=A0A8D0CHD1_SCLFO